MVGLLRVVEYGDLLIDVIRRWIGAGVGDKGDLLAVAGAKTDAGIEVTAVAVVRRAPLLPDVLRHHSGHRDSGCKKAARMLKGEDAANQQPQADGSEYAKKQTHAFHLIHLAIRLSLIPQRKWQQERQPTRIEAAPERRP